MQGLELFLFMKKNIIENAVTAIAVLGVLGFFAWKNHQGEIANSPSYENGDVAIARPIGNIEKLYAKSCQVTKVSDGDTIAVECDGDKLKLRFCGIDVPEKAQPLGTESKAKLENLVMLDQGKVLVSMIEKDRYGRTVAEVDVFSGRKNERGEKEYLFVNGEIVLAGLAYHYKQYSANCPNREVIATAEDMAKKKKIGVWSGYYEKPWDYRLAKK